MGDNDWLTIAMLVLGVGGTAYLLGTRKRDAENADTPDTPDAPPAAASRTEAAAPPKPKPAPVVDDEVPMLFDKKRGAIDAPPRVDYEEDDEIDPTRVGARAMPGRVILQPPVQRIVYDDDAEEDEPTRSESMFLVSATAQTDKGRRRKRNEDSLLVVPTANVFVVADGMGGHRGGELASTTAVKAIASAVEASTFEGEAHVDLPRQASELARALQMANASILEKAQAEPALEGMGTTICAARFSPNKNRLYLAHVGDSRCYRLRDGQLRQMTADHTMANHGVKGPESQHLSRAVGVWPTVPIDILLATPALGDVYLLCSDGLTKMLEDDVIATVLANEEDPDRAVERLVLFANERGGKDNISVVLIRVVPPNWKPRKSVSDAQS